VRGVGSSDAAGVKRRTVVERTAGVERKVSAGQEVGVERKVSAGQEVGVERKVSAGREVGVERKVSAGQEAGVEAEVRAETEAPLVKRLPSLSGARCRLRRAAQLPGIRRVGNAGGQQHRQVNRPKNQCYRESLSWGHVRKRKCNHL
jgi:hypothetical protein